jgi:hypothetical protein
MRFWRTCLSSVFKWRWSAVADGFEERCKAVVADSAKLPFGENSFGALSHADVLCCMPAKLSMLHGCRRVAREGARMVFSVIAPAPSLTPSERQIAVSPARSLSMFDSDYALLLEQSGWHVQERVDVTAEFAKSLRTSLEGMKLGAGALIKVLGADEFSERVTRRQATLAAVDRGLLRREIFAAVTTTGAQSLAA